MDGFEWIIDAAAAFNRYTPAVYEPPHAGANGAASAAGDRPGDDFNRRASWADVLEPKGWRPVGASGRTTYWKRPGKDERGWSATTGHCSNEASGDLLYVFTTNAAPFDSERAYSKFSAYALLHHGGDFRAAAEELAGKGYGKQPAKIKATRHTLNGEAAYDEKPEPLAVSIDEVANIDDLIRAGAEVAWLWPGWLQIGVLNAIAAKGGAGKTRFCMDLLRRIRHGIGWPDGSPIVAPANALSLWLLADNHHDEMVTLSQAFGVKDGVYINAPKTDPYGGVVLETEDDYRGLEARIQAVKPIFVVIDTVGNSTDRNLSKQEDAKAYYQPLQLIARRNRTCILPLTHLNAGGQFLGRRVMEKVRVAVRIDEWEGEERRRLEVVKTNDKRPPALGLTMGSDGNVYDPNPPSAPEKESGPMGRPSQNLKADMEWLKGHLNNGPARAGNTISAAEAAGISKPRLFRAKDALGVTESGTKGHKVWALALDGGFPD